MPLVRLLAIGQIVLLARRHFRRLNSNDRRRLSELVRRGRDLSPAERDELRRLLSKLEPRQFAAATANAFSPVPLPRWLARLTR
ncbi:MAG TPA: hypothetical protein VHJ39_14765 [Solirubrobacteraceae bacterium]|jgi:hypothetical protein|nr:hypothetical protein [Solirubrobacteraceae bacterium]